jgi:ribosome-associated toxin RatA of RatAB toxin-antitoxin module
MVFRTFCSILLWALGSLAWSSSNPHDLNLQVYPKGDRFQIIANYKVALTPCQAFLYLKDYEGAKSIPGIKESKIVKRSGNQVVVERVVQDRILLIPIELRSTVQYKELSDQIIDFEQISGDAKLYQGTWRIEPEGNATRFQFRANVELDSIVPNFIIEYFIENQMSKRFEAMAENANRRASTLKLSCY